MRPPGNSEHSTRAMGFRFCVILRSPAIRLDRQAETSLATSH